jgi:hypothetical protein
MYIAHCKTNIIRVSTRKVYISSTVSLSDASISVSIDDEPNADPDASNGLDLVVAGDGVSDETMNDNADSDGNDYDAGAQEWYVPPILYFCFSRAI